MDLAVISFVAGSNARLQSLRVRLEDQDPIVAGAGCRRLETVSPAIGKLSYRPSRSVTRVVPVCFGPLACQLVHSDGDWLARSSIDQRIGAVAGSACLNSIDRSQRVALDEILIGNS
jgi:hypothetical protein